jgi:hypothetical protein
MQAHSRRSSLNRCVSRSSLLSARATSTASAAAVSHLLCFVCRVCLAPVRRAHSLRSCSPACQESKLTWCVLLSYACVSWTRWLTTVLTHTELPAGREGSRGSGTQAGEL